LERRSKNLVYRVKHPEVAKSVDPVRSFYRAADEFRRRRKFVRYMRIINFSDYLEKPNSKKDFKEFVNELENYRTKTSGIGENKFYNIVAEFLIQPNGQYYYNPKLLFGCKGSFVAEEFRSRIFNTLTLISKVIGEDDNIEGTTKFISKINDLNTPVDVSSAGLLGKKDWYCIKAIQDIIKRKGWTEEELLTKVKRFYQRRVRKVYAEMLLEDIANGQLDSVRETIEKAKKKAPNIRAIEKEEWFNDWEKGIPG